tara:strand:+ start:2106 stop:6899 length:4794 start_codon:yes stop_codon:yes gene_type:complete
MPIVTTNFIVGRMNKSVDERLLPPGEYIDALNIRLGATESTEVGAVENSKGNDRLTTLEYGGSALSAATKCIGAYEDGARETIYWFVHDSANTVAPGGKVDLIISFNTTSQVLQYHVVSTSVLNFDPNYLITGIDLVDATLLFFTDDVNPPRVINVTRNYVAPVANVDQFTEESISVIVKPPGFEDTVGSNVPLTVPTVELVTLPGNENYMEERFISFAYRYRYLDNQYSATSLFTKPAFSASEFNFDTRNYLNTGMVNRYNGAIIGFSTGSSLVSEIDLLYKETGSNIIFVIERFKKEDYGWADNTTKTYSFTNSKIYTTLGSDELLRQYDNVPRLAKAQTIMSNRLIYGNFTDGYDFKRGSVTGSNISLDYATTYIPSSVDLKSLPAGAPGNGVSYTLSGTTEAIANSKITFDFTDLVGKLLTGAVITMGFNIESSKITGTTTTACYISNEDFSTPEFSLSITITLDQNYTTVYDFLISSQFEEAIGTGTLADGRYEPLATADLGSSLTDIFNNTLTPPAYSCVFTKFNSSITDATAQQGFALTGVTPGSNTFEIQLIAMQYQNIDGAVTSNMFEFFRFVSGDAFFSSDNDTSSLHSNRDYEAGIVYMDDYARSSTVLVSEYNTVYIEPKDSVNINSIQVQISSIAPYWAKKYKFVLKPSLGTYNTIFSNFYYVRPSDNMVFFKLEGDNANKVIKGETLIVKADVSGALTRVEKVNVLDVTAESSDFLADAGEPGFADTSQLAGLYMNVKNQNFNISIPDDSVIEEGNQEASSIQAGCAGSGQTAQRSIGYPCFTTQYTAGVITGTTNYTIPESSVIRISIRASRENRIIGCNAKEWLWEQTYISSQDYTDFKKWYDGDNINVTTASPGDLGGVPDGGVYYSAYTTPTVPVPSVPYNFAGNVTCAIHKIGIGFAQAIPGDATSPLYFGVNSGIPGCFPDQESTIEVDIKILRANTLMVFESDPQDANPDLYYDSSQMFDIDANGNHLSGTDIDLGDQDQTSTQDAIVNLDFADVYTFGNGVESYKIKDQLAAKSFQLGERVLAVSNQDYKEADRFEGLTYSGVYSSNSGINNLNEFNLGLVNFKDLETSYGPIQKLHSRKTDVLILQEDRISYVLLSKNLLSDSVGGGAITSIPEILGTQIARLEEYGVSFNPESFISHGDNVYFTDSKRGAVLRLTGESKGGQSDQLFVISESGMRSWFREEFYDNLNNQKLGAFDPYMNEYVLSMNQTPVPMPTQIVACGAQISKSALPSGESFSSTVDYGNVIGSVPIGYIVSIGSITITVAWNGTSVTSGTLTGTGTYNWSKTLNTPNNAVVTVTAVNVASTFVVSYSCPDQSEITVVKVVINSETNANKYIHAEYFWENSNNISPVDSDLCKFGNSNLIASTYDAQVGVRSLGVFPLSGVDLTMRSNKINFDDYEWKYPQDNFKYLSSSTLYANNQADISSLLAASTTIANGSVTNPSTGLYQAKISSLSLPAGNQYLYLIYDYRITSCQTFCYDASDSAAACCDCTIACVSFNCSNIQQDSSIICNQPLVNTYYHTGTGVYPVVGSFVYSSPICVSSQAVPLPSGYYKSEANKYIRIGNSGIVTELVIC